jgi:hypothetical protein
MADTKWMTYAELAEVLGIGGDSARNLVRRKRWPRQPGNDGLTRVGVPVEHIEAAKADAATDASTEPPSDGGADGATVVEVLTRHISRLETELEALKQEHAAERGRLLSGVDVLKAERDAERLRASQVEALNAVLSVERERTAAERARVEEWKAVAGRFASQAEALTRAAESRRGWWPFRRSA